MVLAVQYDERKGEKFYEAACVRVDQGESWSWGVPPSSFVTGSEVAKDKPMPGYALMGLSAPDAPMLLSDVDDMISAHSARESVVLEGEGGSKKGKRMAGKPRARAPKRYKDPIALEAACFYVFLCLWPWWYGRSWLWGVCCTRAGP